MPSLAAFDITDSAAEIAWLRSMPVPRPFVWLPSVQYRRLFYVLLALLLIVVFEGWPEHMSLSRVGTGESWRDVHMQQVPVYLGMLLVVAFVVTCYALYKQFDDSKWMAKSGEVAEANLLSVLHGDRQIQVTYRFFDASGREVEREAVITAEGREPAPALAAGDIVPVLYDRKQPARRNLLWPEVSRYVMVRPDARQAAGPDPGKA